MARRKKISTTISPEAFAVLKEMIRSHQVKNLAEALDLILAAVARQQNRERLEQMTADYYNNASPEVLAEENEMTDFLSRAATEVMFDE